MAMANNKTVVITGAGGYVGGQTSIYFHEQGWRVVGIDNTHPPKHLSQSTYFSKFYVGPFDSEDALELIKNSSPHAIVHTAGTSLVGPSKQDPRPYYQNNFVATKTLVEYLIDNNIKTRLIFSSSAAIYGEPILTPISEEDPQMPVNPYGQSKLMIEMMLESYRAAYGLDYVGFRYFNVCGADSQGRHGQKSGATHIIARVLESIKNNTAFTINGVDYPTEDGTCVRDYVHVEDIARAHLLAVQHAECGFYNLSTGSGYSNRMIVDTALKTVSVEKEIGTGPMRPGDPAVLVGSGEKFADAVGWQPIHDLYSIIKTAWNWYNK
jgi:UDP-glucose 4-epimerase